MILKNNNTNLMTNKSNSCKWFLRLFNPKKKKKKEDFSAMSLIFEIETSVKGVI